MRGKDLILDEVMDRKKKLVFLVNLWSKMYFDNFLMFIFIIMNDVVVLKFYLGNILGGKILNFM